MHTVTQSEYTYIFGRQYVNNWLYDHQIDIGKTKQGSQYGSQIQKLTWQVH